MTNKPGDTDQLGRIVPVHSPPTRIISLVPSQTELLHYLGCGERVVGITRFCVRPDRWYRSKTRIGGTKKVHFDKIRALQPDLILANKEENSREDLETLADEFPVWISDVRNLEQAFDMILKLGQLLGTMPQAQQLSATIQQMFGKLTPSEPLRACYLIWNDPIMTVSGDTFIHEMMRLAGFSNVAASFPERYPSLTEGQLQQLNPEVLLLSSEPFPFAEKHLDRYRQLLPHCRIQLVDGQAFSWYGSRLLESAGYFRELQARLRKTD